MKSILNVALLIAAYCININFATAQEILSKKYKKEAIQQLSKLMNDYYVFPEVAKETGKHLSVQLKKGHFDDFSNNKSFAEALTISVQEINKDKHMKIWVNPPYEAPENSPERIVEEQLYQLERSRKYNAGFNTVKVLEGNVGYLDLRGFAPLETGKLVADAYMKLMANCDAIIIDLSKNGGGSPAMVQYLCSYFFKGDVHLNSLYYREGNRTIDFHTLEKVDGMKMIGVPLFVITSSKTFSGAEEFSYNMQTQKRATLVGQTSGGGANPGGTMPINENLSVFIPLGMAVNPITKTNWEGVGVIPEIETTVEETLNKTHELAKKAAEDYRSANKESNSKMLLELNDQLMQYPTESSAAEIEKTMRDCLDANLLDEFSINTLGYSFLTEKKKHATALVILKANTVFFPNSPNVYDSYAESLMMNDDMEGARENYQKAVDVATKNDDPNASFYQENLDKLEGKIKK